MSEGTLALLGGAPAFESAVPVGQLYFPDWPDYVEAMRGIFVRQYYTNQGPLVRELESALQERLGVRHAICVANATIGLMMAADALGLRGRVITSAFSFIATSQSLTWAGLDPLFCDVDASSHHLDPDRVEHALRQEDVSAVLAVNLWGDVCDHEALSRLAARRGVPLYFDSAHAFGCEAGARAVGGFGALEVFSFHATKVLSAAEGGCVCTNDDMLAARLRNIRSSYGAGAPVHVRRTANGRMSEAQAAIALMSLKGFPSILERNRALFAAYEAGLQSVQGLRLLRPAAVNRTNYQYVVCEIDAGVFGLDRDQLHAVLRAENILARRYFYPGIHRCMPYREQFPSAPADLPVTEVLCSRVLQLPIGQAVDEAAVARITAVVRAAQTNAQLVRAVLAGQGEVHA
ncbi:dTDP-4-amino-4,6-dideoxygalactose transaminase [Paenacidovorax caeni]|uniref:dTDP-4-amino-4,6-dideoxygalactose transaminase n=1 Tax=Paenacidovorax caeni TaxID=343013 RepID=A0A1I7J218_9BURK|nr:DegT/DnrJ/EryC1/StrS family aminotransferase [Paenacidovorax caeni]SFU79266.1 dTDP-4-amino-4,6-dideoxygalactose transaminase [Paenacidovorax caeni]